MLKHLVLQSPIGKKGPYLFEKRQGKTVTVPDLQSIFQNESYSKVSNIRFTTAIFPEKITDGHTYITKELAAVMKKEGRHNLLAFDIDHLHLNIDDVDEFVNLFLHKYGILPQSCGIMWSGNGLHIYIPTIDTISLQEYGVIKPFKIAAYNAISRELKLKKENYDPQGFTPWLAYGRMLFSYNEKPGKVVQVRPALASDKGHNITPTYTWEEILNKFLPNPIRLEGIFQKFKIAQVNAPKKANPLETPLIGCDFIKDCVKNPNEVKEPHRFTAYKVLANAKNGRLIAHTIFKERDNYDEAEVDDKFDRAQKFKHLSCKSVNKSFEKCQDCPHFGKIYSPADLIHKNKWRPLIDIRFRQINSKGMITPRVDYTGLVEYLLETLEGKIYRSSHYLYIFKETYWKQYNHEEFYIKYVRPLIGTVGDTTTKTIKEVFASVKVSTPKAPQNILWPPPGKLYFKNGIVTLKYDKETGEFTKTLTPHIPEESSYFVLPFDYVEKDWEKNQRFTDWLDSFMEADSEGKRRQAVVQEHIGNIIQGGLPRGNNKALFIYGGANNGKSEFFKVIRGLLHETQAKALDVSSISTQSINLVKGALVAIDSDFSSSNRIKNDSTLKKLITGDPLESKKLWVDLESTVVRTKVVLLSNGYPTSSDKSSGFYRRFSMVHFPKFYDRDNSNPEMAKEILDSCMPSLVSWAIGGVERLAKNKGFFSSAPEEKRMLDDMARANDPVHSFMADHIHIVESPELYRPYPRIPIDKFYLAFRAWCRAEGVQTTYTKHTVTMRVKNYLIRKYPQIYNKFEVAKKMRDAEKGNVVWCYRSILWEKEINEWYANAQVNLK